MKNKEDDSKAKSEEYLAFESLAKRIITTNKEDIDKKKAAFERKKETRTKTKGSKQ